MLLEYIKYYHILKKIHVNDFINKLIQEALLSNIFYSSYFIRKYTKFLGLYFKATFQNVSSRKILLDIL